ncbi:MAG: hypothetical protein NC097_04110 [Clostridium sp.]|nr:hypothetical protein [Prevotella sp.]MCM1428961.1 hypothetical protein [Clostridium sp.]MCM1475995.1 hypothetical protein [Muribaculaceae bacterium]
MKKLLLNGIILLSTTLGAYAQVPIDLDKITNWSGEGSNRAALAITKGTDPNKDQTWVWGYRFDVTKDENGKNVYPTGEDMFKAICANNDNLVLLTQYTGQYGSTVCGIGIGNAGSILENLHFDFEMAKTYEWINFDYYSVNTTFGQKVAPGDNTPVMAQQAIDDALESHYIQHPIDAKAYGYPAYDYDCWKAKTTMPAENMWLAGWYEGYWSYWTGSSGEDWMYSGTGFTGRQIRDGYIDGWTYTIFEEAGMGGMGDGTIPCEDAGLLYYVPANHTTGIDEITNDEYSGTTYWYSLSGILAGHGDNPELTPGIYIRKNGNKTAKILIK